MNTPIHSCKVDDLSVRVYADQTQLAADAARMAQGFLQQTLAQRETARVILACANSQIQFLEALVSLGGLDWPRVAIFHMDEYLGIEPGHPASFRRFLQERVIGRVRPGVFHCLRGEAEQPLDECDRYAALLNGAPIDLCCLGIGENGHIAFNDPPVAEFADRRTVKLVKLDEECRRQQVGEGHYPALAAVPQYAYTLTISALCAARRLLCVVPEQRKARAVRTALTGPVSPACPASILRRQAQCELFLDAASAGNWLPKG